MSKKRNTRQLIKDVSLDLFSKLGFAGSSVRHIGREIGIRESALYNHFKSKEDILINLMEDARKASVGVNLITDELLEKLSNPHEFMSEFVKVLLKYWSTEKQKKYLRLVMIEQFREIKGVNISLSVLIEESIRIWKMIFSEMLNYKYIKKNDPLILAEEFVHPLLTIRLQYLIDEGVKSDIAFEKAQSHVDYFWKTIKK